MTEYLEIPTVLVSANNIDEHIHKLKVNLGLKIQLNLTTKVVPGVLY